MKVLLLDNYDSFTFNLYHYFVVHPGVSVDVIRNDEIDLVQIGTYDRLVISPGPGLPAESGLLMEVLRSFETHGPILGICLGLQAITEFYGGRLKNLDAVKHGLEENCHVIPPVASLYTGIPEEFKVGRYHSWVADRNFLPSCLKVTAIDDTGEIMGLQHISLPISGVQYHPESIMTPLGMQIIRNWLTYS